MKIGIIGDLILSPSAKFDDFILKKLRDTDMNIANLESPFINESFKEGNKNAGLHQLINDCDQLKSLNIKAVSLANNHMFDFGEEGLYETIRILDEAGIVHFGAGRNLQEASALKHLNIEGKTVAIGGFVSRYIKPHEAGKNKAGTAPLIEKNIKDLLDASNAEYKLLFNHWNQEYEDYPDPLFLDMSRKLLNHCNSIIGSHPHCIQGIQEKEGKVVFHSIGNFIMPHTQYHLKPLGKFPDHCYEAFIVILHIDEENNMTFEKVPYRIEENGNQIMAMTDEEAAALELKFNEISKPLNLGYEEYYSFFKRNKRRKFRPILGRNHTRNNFKIWYTLFILSSIQKLTAIAVKVLEYLGIRQFIRKRFAFILNRMFKL